MAIINQTRPRHGIASAVNVIPQKELASKAQLAELSALQGQWEAAHAKLPQFAPAAAEAELVAARAAFSADASDANTERLRRASDLRTRMVENQSLHQAAYEHCCRLTVDKIGPACKTVLARAATLISRAVTALEAQEVENAQLWQIPFTESDTLQSARALLGHVEKRITHIGDLKDLSTTASPAHLLDKILTVTATPPTAPAPVATTPTAPTPTMASA